MEANAALQTDETKIMNFHKLLQFANQSRENKFLTDITLKVGDISISAHRLVLAYYSTFFKCLFQTNIKYKDVVEIKSFEGDLIKELVEFMYTRQMNINSQNAMDLLKAADYMQHESAKEYCFQFFQSIIVVENFIDILSAAVAFANKPTILKVSDFISKNLKDSLFADNFKFLQKDVVILLLSTSKYFRIKHTVIYQALLTWITHDKDNRKLFFGDLFKLLPFTRLSTNFLESIVLKENLVNENPECYDLALKSLNQKQEDNETIHQTKLVSVGGVECGCRVFTVCSVSPNSSDDIKYPDLPIRVRGHAVVVFKNILYCIGGSSRRYMPMDCLPHTWEFHSSRQVFTLNFSTLRWQEVASMKSRRSDLRAVIFQDQIQHFRRFRQKALPVPVHSVESYLSEINEWEQLSLMKVCRSRHGLIACKGSLYVIGGKNDKDKFVSSVEKLQSLDEEWKQVASMNYARCAFAAVQCNGFIYVVGGQGLDFWILAIVEKFDPIADQWSLVENCSISRFGHSACVMQGKIYVVGGCSTTNNSRKFVEEIECYDPIKGTWTDFATCLFRLNRIGLFAV